MRLLIIPALLLALLGCSEKKNPVAPPLADDSTIVFVRTWHQEGGLNYVYLASILRRDTLIQDWLDILNDTVNYYERFADGFTVNQYRHHPAFNYTDTIPLSWGPPPQAVRTVSPLGDSCWMSYWRLGLARFAIANLDQADSIYRVIRKDLSMAQYGIVKETSYVAVVKPGLNYLGDPKAD